MTTATTAFQLPNSGPLSRFSSLIRSQILHRGYPAVSVQHWSAREVGDGATASIYIYVAGGEVAAKDPSAISIGQLRRSSG